MNKSKENKVRKPLGWLYLGAATVLLPIYKIKYNVKFDRSGIKDLKGPAVVLGQHLSNKDHVLVGLTLYPRRVNFVASRHFTMKPLLKKIFSVMGVITKKMFCRDISAVKSMLSAVKDGRIIMLFPEGRLPANGKSVPVTDGTVSLIRKLGVDV